LNSPPRNLGVKCKTEGIYSEKVCFILIKKKIVFADLSKDIFFDYELRETRINLRIIIEKPLLINEKLQKVFSEVNELIAIISSSISTAKKNQ